MKARFRKIVSMLLITAFFISITYTTYFILPNFPQVLPPVYATPSPANYEYAESEDTSSTTSTAWQDKVSLIFTADAADYLIMWSAEVAHGATTGSTKSQLLEDGTLIDELFWFRHKSTSNWLAIGGVQKRTLTAASHNYTIQWTSSDGVSSSIRRARILAWKKLAEGYAESEGESGTQSTSYVDKVALTFTAELADYLIIANVKVSSQITAGGMNATIVETSPSSVTLAEMQFVPYGTSNYPLFATIKKMTLSAGSVTFKIQFKTNNAVYYAYVKYARIIAIKLSSITNYYAESDGDSSTASTTYVNKTTSTFTPPAGAFLAFGSSELRSSTTTVLYKVRIERDATVDNEAIVLPHATNSRESVFSLRLNNLTATSHDFNLQYCSSTGSLVYIRRAREMNLLLPVEGYNLNLRVRDWDLTDDIQGGFVYKDSDVKISDANGWANWTGQTGTVQVKVKYYGFWVNGTFSVVMDSDKTINVKCNLYDVTITVQENVQSAYLVQANVTVFNATSTSGNKIKSGTTGSNGQVSLSNLPNNTLTITQYGGSGYSIVIGNTTQLISSDGQSFTVTSNQNYTSTSNPYYLMVWIGAIVPLKGHRLKRCLKRKNSENSFKGGEKQRT